MTDKTISEHFQFLVDARNNLVQIRDMIKHENQRLDEIPRDQAQNPVYRYIVSQIAKSVTHAGKLPRQYKFHEYFDLTNNESIDVNVKAEWREIIAEIANLNDQISARLKEVEKKLFQLYPQG